MRGYLIWIDVGILHPRIEQCVVLQFSCLKRCNFNILQCLRKNGRNRIMKVIFVDCNSAEKAKFCGCEMFFDEFDERKRFQLRRLGYGRSMASG